MYTALYPSATIEVVILDARYQKLVALRKQRVELKARHYKLRGMLNKVGTG